MLRPIILEGKVGRAKNQFGYTQVPYVTLLIVFLQQRAHAKSGGLSREVRWIATIAVVILVRYQSYSIDRLVLFVVRILGRRIVGNLNRIKWGDHERNASPGRGVCKDG